MQEGTVKCHKCKTPVVYEAREVMNGKNYHVKCAQEARDRKTLYDYINEQAGGTVNWATITSQCKTFQRLHKLSYADILLAVKYQYEVLQPKGPRNPEHAKGIGLVPHIMEQAKRHWEKEEQRKASIVRKLETMGEQETIKVKINPREKTKQFIDPMSLFEEGGI